MQKTKQTLFRFDAPELDTLSSKDRETFVIERTKEQLRFMKENVPFYAKRYAEIDISSIKTLNDCAKKIPALRKADIRNLESPYDLLPSAIRQNIKNLYLYRGTGGTTGEPTSMFYSYNDWKAIVDAMVRPVKEIQELFEKKQIIAFNGYNQGHISGPIFDDTIRRLGGLPIPRHFGADDVKAVKQMARHKCNIIICPPTSTHKGGTLEELLNADIKSRTNYINGNNVKCIFHSSTSMTDELRDELDDLGIAHTYNYYGSTDVLPTAVSCIANPNDLHILFGHTSLFVVDEHQTHVKSGKRGLVIAGRIGSYTDTGSIGNCEATQLLNYHVGDEVTYIDEPCKCGRRTPRIRNIKRVLDIQEKIDNGCEKW